jgi:prepilin-type processing-associated H-X9-DG protein
MRGIAQGAPATKAQWKGRVAILSDFEFRDRNNFGYQKLFSHKRGVNVAYADGSVRFILGQWDSFYYSFGGDTFPGSGDGTWGLLDSQGK